MFELFFKDQKHRCIDKLYNCFFVKTAIIEDFKINDKKIDLILITNYGLFLFRIYDNIEFISFDNNIVSYRNKKEIIKENPFDILVKRTDFITKKYEWNYPVYKEVIFYKNDLVDEKYSVDAFKEKVDKMEKIIPNEAINDLYKKLKGIKEL